MFFPLILLALGFTAFAAYGFSSSVRARVDDYARVIRAAHDAHLAADAHLSNANRASGIASRHAWIASQHARAQLAGPRTPRGTPPMQAPGFPAPGPGPAPAAPGPASPVLAAPASPVAPVIPGPSPSAPDMAVVHADAAQAATVSGVDHAIAATVANQQAAQSTADAAKIAQTGAERDAVAASAARVVAREKKIGEALASLGVGQCGVRSYSHVTPQIRDAILAKLHAEGMAVTGDDPWDIDTQQADVKLRAVWDPATQVLKLIVTASSFLAPCSVIWGRIDPILRGMIGT